jgi:intein/homing endonuclease
MGKKERILALYNEEHIKNGFSYKAIQEKYGIERGQWTYYAKQLGLNCDGRKHRPNDDYFNVLDSYNKNYILGFLYADGCITNDGRVSILLNEKDIEILKFIQKEICPKVEIKHSNYQNIKRSPQIKLRFHSKEIYKRLEELGFCIQKTATDSNIFEYIPEEWKYAFIQGYLDGDGNVRFQKYPTGNCYRCSISFANGSRKLLTDIDSYFYNLFNFNGRLREHENKSKYYTLSYDKQDYILKIAEYLFFRPLNNFSLQRKKDNIKGIVEYLNNTEVK